MSRGTEDDTATTEDRLFFYFKLVEYDEETEVVTIAVLPDQEA